MTDASQDLGGATEVVPGRLYALGGVIELDGRVTWAPAEERGYQPVNCYLLREPGNRAALVVDPGLAFQRDIVVRQMRAILGSGSPISVFLTRSELDVLGSFGAVASAFPVQSYYAGGTGNPFDAFDDASSLDARGTASYGRLSRAPSGFTVALSPERGFEVLRTPLRLLATYWGYDHGTKTLFTSDCFTHVTLQNLTDSRIVDVPRAGAADVDRVRRHLLCKFSWLRDVDHGMDEIRSSLEAIFAQHEVLNIAPGYGCVLKGREIVEEHVARVMTILDGGP